MMVMQRYAYLLCLCQTMKCSLQNSTAASGQLRDILDQFWLLTLVQCLAVEWLLQNRLCNIQVTASWA